MRDERQVGPQLQGCLPAFAGDRRGGVAVIFALALLPMVALAGAALDYNRSVTERVALQRALDASVLAGAVLNLPDDKRVKRAEDTFTGVLPASVRSHLKRAEFSLDKNKSVLTGTAQAEVPTTLTTLLGVNQVGVDATASSLIARPQVRQLDLVMCIDGTGSMQSTIDAVKANALNFEANLNAELTKRQITPFDAMRVRVITYRDFGGNTWFDPNTGGWAYTKSGWEWIDAKDPNRFKHVGDLPPMNVSGFYDLPANRASFSSFVQGESAWGGGDEPESGLECVASAIDSPWAKGGDSLSNGKKLTGVYPTVVVWTDANAHPPGHAKSLQNDAYPSASVMPRTHPALAAKWNNASKIDQANRILVFFGGPSTWKTAMDPDGWPPVFKWPGFYSGGTLADGNAKMVSILADALASKISTPVISH